MRLNLPLTIDPHEIVIGLLGGFLFPIHCLPVETLNLLKLLELKLWFRQVEFGQLQINLCRFQLIVRIFPLEPNQVLSLLYVCSVGHDLFDR